MTVNERIIQLIRLRRELFLLENKYTEAVSLGVPFETENIVAEVLWKLDAMIADLHNSLERPVSKNGSGGLPSPAA